MALGITEILGGVGAILGLTKKDKTGQQIADATAAQIAAQQEGMKVYREMMDKAMQTGLATNLSQLQTQYDVARQIQAQNNLAQLPYRTASLSALQALPRLQQLLGMPAYELGKTVYQTNLPEVNYMQSYQSALDQLAAADKARADAAAAQQAQTQQAQGQTGGGFGSPNLSQGTLLHPGNAYMGLNQQGNMYPGQVISQNGQLYTISAGADPSQFFMAPLQQTGGNKVMPQDTGVATPPVDPTVAAAGGSTQNLTAGVTATPMVQQAPMENLAYAINESPLYQWQLRRATEGLNNQLASAGLSGSTYAQRELARVAEGLGAQERQRQVSDLQWMTNLGMGNQPGSVATPTIGSLGSGQAGLYSQMAGDLGSAYGQMGMAQGQGMLAQAQYNATKPDPFGQLLGAAWMFGGGMGARAPGSTGSYNPYAIASGIGSSAGAGMMF